MNDDNPRSRWWPGDDRGLAVATYVLLVAYVTLPLCLLIKGSNPNAAETVTGLSQALFGYFGWSCTFITMPFP